VDWAEETGIGELGLMPDQFWSLTLREFQLKHAAFVRAEDRKRSLMFELAGLVAMTDEKGRAALNSNANALKRYVTMPWLEHPNGNREGLD
jgi:hypothetical protein